MNAFDEPKKPHVDEPKKPVEKPVEKPAEKPAEVPEAVPTTQVPPVNDEGFNVA